MGTAVELPHWDMAVVYPGLDSQEFETGFQSVVRAVDGLASTFERYGIDRQENLAADARSVQAFEDVMRELADASEQLHTAYVYIYCFVTTDSRNNLAQARLSEMQQHLVRLSKLQTRLTAWLGSLDVEALIERSNVARELSYLVRRAAVVADHMMSPEEEDLAAELSVTGGTAWGKLHGNVSSQLAVSVVTDGQRESLPMSVVRNQAYDPDRRVRRRAYEAELDTWAANAVPLCAALNSIKGETTTLAERRSWSSALDMSLFNNRIDRETLEVMLDAARASFPHFRRYLHAKARILDLPALAWYDLFAPVGDSERGWEFEESRDFLLEQFGSYSTRLRDYAARAFDDRWIDAEPRPGKRDGAFCISLRAEESRVLANYRPTYDGMSTLAHELGHGYHNYNLARRPFLQRESPMTLAETASIFCETIVREAALERATEREQVGILESSLQSTCQVVVDITSRFIFESAIFERRKQRELSVDEFNELMLDAQRQTYADGLEESTLHPYMWAVKGHYYSVGRPFYNYPYMFGLLFGLGLYAHYREDAEGFRRSYDDLLASTGQADVAPLAQTFGIDITRREFWDGSLRIVQEDIERFETLAQSNGVSLHGR